MQIHISPRHLKLTPGIYAYVAEKIGHLESIVGNILAAHVVLLHDETRNRQHIVKVHIAVPGPDIFAEVADDDLYAAIDKVIDKLTRQLRKRKTRLVDTKKHRARTAKEEKKRGTARR